MSEILPAMVLTAGEGVRLRPLTLQTPKPLLPLNGRPHIDYVIGWLKNHGVTEMTFNLYHLGDQIETYIGDGHRHGIKAHFNHESQLLGTAGGVLKARQYLGKEFIVVYGDILTDFDLTAMIAAYRANKAVGMIAGIRLEKPWEVGVIDSKGDRITGFREKPPGGAKPGEISNTGIYVLHEDIFRYVATAGPCDFARDVFPAAIRAGAPLKVFTLPPWVNLIDIGTIEKYEFADKQVRSGHFSNIDLIPRKQSG